MSELKDELDPPFEILEPADWRGPVVFNSPHSGNVYPRAFLSTSRLDDAALTKIRRAKVGFVFQSFQLRSMLAATRCARSSSKNSAH